MTDRKHLKPRRQFLIPAMLITGGLTVAGTGSFLLMSGSEPASSSLDGTFVAQPYEANAASSTEERYGLLAENDELVTRGQSPVNPLRPRTVDSRYISEPTPTTNREPSQSSAKAAQAFAPQETAVETAVVDEPKLIKIEGKASPQQLEPASGNRTGRYDQSVQPASGDLERLDATDAAQSFGRSLSQGTSDSYDSDAASLANEATEPLPVDPYLPSRSLPQESEPRQLTPIEEAPTQSALSRPNANQSHNNLRHVEPSRTASAQPVRSNPYDAPTESTGQYSEQPSYSTASRDIPQRPNGFGEFQSRQTTQDFATPVRSLPVVTPSGQPGDRSLEGLQQPVLAIQKFAPAEIQVGKTSRFSIKVKNVSSRPALGVVVRDQVPSGARLVSTTPSADEATSNLRWDLGTLAAGEERTMHMEITPTEEGDIGSVATVTFAAQASARSLCTKPQLALRMTAAKEVLIGGQQRVHIELHNPGSGDATGVLLSENVPENVRHQAGPVLEFEVGLLKAGETKELDLMLTAQKPGHVVNLLTARADGNLEVQQKVEFDVVAPDLDVALNGPSRRYLERPATYKVRVANDGTAAAKDLRLVTHLPRGLQFVKATNLGEYDASAHAVYWSLAELPEGQNGEVEVVTMPVTPGELTVRVEAQASNGLKDQDSQQVRVEGIAAIKFEVIDVEDPIEVGGETEYEIRLGNQGTKAATNVIVQVTAPTGMQILSASGDSRYRLQGGVLTFDPIAKLTPQSQGKFRVRVQGVQEGDHRLVVEVSSDDLSTPVRKEESTRVFGDN